jgi:hypothetical protein
VGRSILYEIALLLAVFCAAAGVSLGLDEAFSASDGSVTVKTSNALSADIDDGVQISSSAGFGEGVYMSGVSSGSGNLSEVHSVQSLSGNQSAAVSANATDAESYDYDWGYQSDGDNQIRAWEDASIIGGKNIDLSASAFNSNGETALVGASLDFGSIVYSGSAEANESRAIASQDIDWANGGMITLRWQAVSSGGSSTRGYTSVSSGAINSSSTVASSDDASAGSSVSMTNVTGTKLSVFSEARNRMSLQRSSLSSRIAVPLDASVTSSAGTSRTATSFALRRH